MTRLAFAFGTFALVVSLSACKKSDESEKDAKRAAAEIMNKPVSIDAGPYQLAIDCLDKDKNAKLPKIQVSYDFQADGSYTEYVKNLDSGCLQDCEFVVYGTYIATATKFTFNQQASTATDGSSRIVTASKTLSVFGYVQEKGQIILQDDKTDNACNGDLLFVLAKK